MKLKISKQKHSLEGVPWAGGLVDETVTPISFNPDKLQALEIKYYKLVRTKIEELVEKDILKLKQLISEWESRNERF